MAKYKISGGGWVEISKNVFIPNEPQSRFYKEVQLWLEQGNKPDPEFSEKEIETKKDSSLESLRKQRNLLLQKTDFMMTYDYYNNKLSVQDKVDMVTYRQALRDLPAETKDPTNIVWPIKPKVVQKNEI